MRGRAESGLTIVLPLATGAEARLTNEGGPRAVVLVNGGQGSEVPGTWSATLEWLVRRLAPRLPELAFVEVRYRIKSWRRLDWCVEDCRAAIDLARDRGAESAALVGFSMGGAVATSAADDEDVRAVVGLAPWLPEQLDVSPLRGRRLVVLHGALDRWLPGIPGVSPANSRAGFERASALTASADYTLIHGGVHGVALRAPWGLQRLPRAGRWAALLEAELRRYAAG